jgi:hypothetical protein
MDAPLKAEGIDSTVSLVGDKVVVRRRGVKTLGPSERPSDTTTCRPCRAIIV